MSPLDDTTTKNCVAITPYSQEYDLIALQTFCYLFLKDRRLVSETADKKQQEFHIYTSNYFFFFKKYVFIFSHRNMVNALWSQTVNFFQIPNTPRKNQTNQL